MTMAAERLESLEQVRAFVEDSEGLDFAVADRSSRNDFVRRMNRPGNPGDYTR